MTHDVKQCPHFHPASGSVREVGRCDLLQRLTGVADERLCHVPLAACRACREGSTPSETHLNPVVASLLYDLTSRLIEAAEPEASGDDSQRTRRLRDWAEENLFLGSDPEPRSAEATTLRDREKPRGRSDRPLRLGLIGSNVATGLGALNRGIARHLPIDRWLVVPHPIHRDLADPTTCRIWRGTNPETAHSFLDGLDWLLFCEQPQSESVVTMAHERGVKIACVPMWEHLDEFSPWIRQVDLMICPTRFCHERVGQVRERLGLRTELTLVPWPIELDRFPFRRREVCRKFVFINGHGGMRTLDQQTPGWDGRKGLWIIRAAAKRAPRVPILVRTQTVDLPSMPGNVEVRPGNPDDPAALYEEGDVCIQPSRWEGLGLPLLECQASGLPLITADAPPMNEHRPWVTLQAIARKAPLAPHRAIPVHEVDPTDLAKTLLQLHGAEISEASLAARRFVESEHSWATAAPRLLNVLASASSNS